MRSLPRTLLALAALCLLAASAAAFERREIRVTTPAGEVSMVAEMAMTAGQRVQGLMGREDFGPGDAMLFVFPLEKRLSFWMKNTPVSLDIVFFDGQGRWTNTAARTVPFSTNNHVSRGKGQFVLELAAGEARRLGIGPGSRLSVSGPPP